MQVQEGYMPYLGYQTYYRIVGKQENNKKPLVLLHGGPGSTHNYFELLDNMAVDGRQIIMYDQLGCGKSAVPSNPSLWKKETWANELIQLRDYLDLDEIHLLGQSWGGMLAFIYMCDYHPKGIKSLILSGTLPSAKLWAQEQHRMINNFMSPEDKAAIKKAEQTGNYNDPAYIKANALYMEQHAAATPTANSPEPLRRKKVAGTESYLTAWGPNEYSPEGTLRDYDYLDQMKDIQVPTLITSGINDLCTPLIAKTMYDGIPNSKWELFAHSRHMPFVEENAKYEQILTKWLDEND
ncbi:proline iminopeptidase [Companilactobacillus sp.]|uniref:proline iminopeptidase n=1 Tax=Companilactobacillus sp. TaxID=2767905 RepID=UPI0025C04DDD|nr:proline iminopeptidase-family hydrolase [Companilactobacillus sp.]MCH4008980.1 proline iminopeptidase-family hydrolase [Companilactobacillus sp.]MCH4050841.1 proline iminopeptidase-family hydrolase [Companilactobacillus sp.]MCH4076923.1 proline iminopeptidase-family hydrolase [Companilactobacillus sp.]MCH4125498.1 proline iminopeptidase-family hydrolase [Companilactobacillus sp.]MCI1311207.1 proline iminopeptidase-family hydrolase [Companilactobacillus sp.]